MDFIKFSALFEFTRATDQSPCLHDTLMPAALTGKIRETYVNSFLKTTGQSVILRKVKNCISVKSDVERFQGYRKEGKVMKVFAHRGFSGKYPENTMLAFQKAAEVGCYGIELDVQLTKDDEIVIMHDETIDRTTSGTGNIRDYTYQELCLVDCYGKFKGEYEFQRIPTLREYLTWVKDTGLVTNIELKNSVYYYEHLEEKVIDMVREFQMEDRVIFSSFNLVSINKCKKLLPKVPMGYLMEARMDNMGYFTEENGVEYYHPDKNFLTEEMVQDCHAHGIGVNVWTVNKKDLMKQLNSWKVDGIFTNFPDRAKELGLEK